MNTEFDARFPATRAGFALAVMTLEEFCLCGNIAGDLVYRLQIIIEELYTNTIKHGYGGECDRTVRIALSLGTGVTLLYEDEAPAFDPTSWSDSGLAPLGSDERPDGKAGIALVLGLATETRYQALDPGNRLTVFLADGRRHGSGGKS